MRAPEWGHVCACVCLLHVHVCAHNCVTCESICVSAVCVRRDMRVCLGLVCVHTCTFARSSLSVQGQREGSWGVGFALEFPSYPFFPILLEHLLCAQHCAVPGPAERQKRGPSPFSGCWPSVQPWLRGWDMGVCQSFPKRIPGFCCCPTKRTQKCVLGPSTFGRRCLMQR